MKLVNVRSKPSNKFGVVETSRRYVSAVAVAASTAMARCGKLARLGQRYVGRCVA